LYKSKTTKLFYGVYPYKLVWYTPLAHYFRGGDLTTIRDMLDSLHHQYAETGSMQLMHWGGIINVKPHELHQAQKVFTAISKNPNKIRVEGRYLQLYSEHKDWLEKLARQIDIYEWWEPEGLLQPNTVIMGESMKGWEYRVRLGRNIPKNFCTWALNNLDKIKIGNVFKEALDKGQPWNLTNLYFYVRNEKMLNLVTLVLGPSIIQIDKIIIEDKNA
jgi:hypothetical protein